jgi:hypothetical protein
MTKIVIAGVLLISFLVGCATQEPLYYWGNYSQSLYKYKKAPQEETLQAHKAVLVNIMEESGKRNKKIPPGICCEYGYILLREGNTQQALYYFEMEEKSYPESSVFIQRLKSFTSTPSTNKEEK